MEPSARQPADGDLFIGSVERQTVVSDDEWQKLRRAVVAS